MFRGKEEQGRGKGADWEGALIKNEIYDARSTTIKFAPVLLEAADEPYVPEPLRGYTRYTLTSEESYGALYDFLLGQAGVEPGAVGEPRPRPRRRGAPLTFGPAGGTAVRQPNDNPLVRLPYPSLGALFKGRDALLSELRASFQTEAGRAAPLAIRVLHGLGGVGKTRAAVEYGLRYAADHSAVFFVDAESAEALGRNLAALAGPLALDLPEQEEREEEARQAAVLHWLNGHPGWLLILDNLDTREAAMAAQGVLATLRGGHVLLTGRISEWSGGLAALALPVLDLDAATQFLLERTASRRRKTADDAAAARTLGDRLGGLALALEQAGAYVNHRRLTFAAYLQAWNEKRETVLSWSDDLAMQYPRSLAVTWQTSFDQLTDGGRRLLQRLAWLAPEPIPESLLDVPLEDDETLDVREALAHLESYSLVTRAGDEPTFTVHRLVQEVTRTRSDGGEEIPSPLVEALTWVDSAFAGEPHDVRTWPVLDPLTPHAAAVAEHAAAAGIDRPTTRLLNQVAVLLLAKARATEAEPLIRRALAIDERRLGSDHPEVAVDLNNLAQLLQDTNRLAEAEPLMRRALAIDEHSFGPDHPMTAIDLNNLAQLLEATNRLAEAEPLMRSALAIDERNWGPDHPSIAVGLNNLAKLLLITYRFAEAEPLLRRALTIAERGLGPDHPSVATSLNNLALLLKDTHRLAEAEPLMRRALAIDERSFGAEHPEVATDLSNLAMLLRDNKGLAEAEPLVRRALAIDERSFGPDHPKLALHLNNLALLLRDTKRLAEAEPLMRRALAIDERSLGPDHPSVATHLSNLATLLTNTDRLAEAEPLIRRALTIDERSLGPDHPKVAIRLNNLALLLRDTDRLAEAEPLMRRALAIDERAFGSEHPRVVTELENLASIVRNAGRSTEADALIDRARAIEETLAARRPTGNDPA